MKRRFFVPRGLFISLAILSLAMGFPLYFLNTGESPAWLYLWSRIGVDHDHSVLMRYYGSGGQNVVLIVMELLVFVGGGIWMISLLRRIGTGLQNEYKTLRETSRLHRELDVALRKFCPQCGCDLHATPGRCPECGTEMETPMAAK